jgi:hypothetical protein
MAVVAPPAPLGAPPAPIDPAMPVVVGPVVVVSVVEAGPLVLEVEVASPVVVLVLGSEPPMPPVVIFLD